MNNITEISVNIDNSGSRNEVRKRILEYFLQEVPGKGNGALASRYNYVVKDLEKEGRVILTRPANLKNGFDFLIRVEGINFDTENKRRRDYPKHDEIISDLNFKKNSQPKEYLKLYILIQKIYKCENVSEDEMAEILFNDGYDIDMLIHVIKWFFIEQDIRYWNFSGRDMLMSSIPMPQE